MRRIVFFIITVALMSAYPFILGASYRSELRKATKKVEMYDIYTGSLKLEIFATLFTDEFRDAFIDKHAEINHLNETEAEQSTSDNMRRQANGWEVYLSMYAPKDYRKLALGEDTFWKVYLTDENGEAVSPVSIEKLKSTPYWREMFPKTSRWAVPYMIVFPKVPLGKETSFVMESVVGETKVKWKLK